MELTKYVEPPGRFHLWTALTILASSLRRNVYMKRGLFTLFPNLYVALVGPTGLGKSISAEIGMDHFGSTLQDAGTEVMRGKITSWYLYEWFGQMSQSGKPAVAHIFSSELRTLLGDLNKSELVAMLTDIYGCPNDADYRTKSYGVIKLQQVYINLLVCSTPEWLTTGISTDDVSGGFTGRFIYVCSDKTEREFPFPEDFYNPAETEQMKGILREDLEKIGNISGPIIIEQDAKAKYSAWYKTRMKEFKDERLVGYYARKRDHILKIGMLLSVSEGDSLVMTTQHLDLAHDVLGSAEKHMMLAFRGIVGDPVLKYRETVLGQIRKMKTVSLSELLGRNQTRVDVDGLKKILETLSAEGRVVWKSEGIDKHGRVMYVVRLTENEEEGGEGDD